MYACHYWLKDANGKTRYVTTDQYMGEIGEDVYYDGDWYIVDDWTEEYLDQCVCEEW